MTHIILYILLCVFLITKGKKMEIDQEEGENTEGDYNADVFCKHESRLIKMEQSDEILVVDVPVNSSVLLECKYW